MYFNNYPTQVIDALIELLTESLVDSCVQAGLDVPLLLDSHYQRMLPSLAHLNQQEAELLRTLYKSIAHTSSLS